jgi:hypothetical protein
MRQSQGKLYFVGDSVGIASALNGLEGGGRTSTQSCAGQTKGAHCEQEAVEMNCGRGLPIRQVACEKLPGSSTAAQHLQSNAKQRIGAQC